MRSREGIWRVSLALILSAGILSAHLGAQRPPQDRSQETETVTQFDGYFPDVALVTQDGRRVRFYSEVLRGKTVLINFIFTQCEDLCPRTASNLRRVQDLLGDALGRTVYIVSISIDPANDTPGTLKTYAEHVGARKGWDFLTGNAKDIELIRRKLGVFDREEDDDPTLHTGMLVYGNEAKGVWRATYVMAPPQQIVRSVSRITGSGPVR